MTSGRHPRGRPSGRNPRGSGRPPRATGSRRAPPPLTERPNPGADGPLAGRRVALVDDDRLVLAMVSKFLQRRGARVRTFQDPEQALDVLVRDQPDAALVDMNMPQMEGMELVRRLKRRLRGLPFPMLFLTSVEDEASFQEAFELGVSDYLVKPTTEAELAAKLGKAMAARSEQGPRELPDRLDGFELIEEVRRGELARIYLTRDAQGRSKSLKVLRPELAGDARALLSLRREIDVVAACDHPGILALNASGLDGPFLYYVTDEVPLRSLGKEVSEDSGLSPRELLGLLRSVGLALEHLHERRFLLGDLSPESIGRLRDGRFVITELAAARTLRRVERGDEGPLNVSRYLAPELIQGGADLRADLYSLGVLALESYATRPAVRARGTGRIDARSLTDGLPEALSGILDRLTDPDPQSRFPSATALVDALDGLVGDPAFR